MEKFKAAGCRFIATKGTADFFEKKGFAVQRAKKISEGVPNVLDVIRSGMCDLVVDIPKKANVKESDGFKMRRTASECSVNIITSIDTVNALADVMEGNYSTDNVDQIAVTDIK